MNSRKKEWCIRSLWWFSPLSSNIFWWQQYKFETWIPEKRMMDHVFLMFSLLFMTAILTWNMKPGYKNNESSLFDVLGRWVPQLFMELSHDEVWIWSITDPEVAWFWGSLVIDAWKGANFALREQIYLYRCQRKPNPWKPSCINSPRLIIGACI